MNGPGEHFLAGTGFPPQKHRGIAAGNGFGHSNRPFHGRTVMQNPFKRRWQLARDRLHQLADFTDVL